RSELTEPVIEGLVMEYDFLQPYFRRTKTYDRDEAFHILQGAQEISLVTIWTPPARLGRQFVKREFRTPTGPLITWIAAFPFMTWVKKLPWLGRRLAAGRPRKVSPRKRQFLNMYQQSSAQLVSYYRRWFQFCDETFSNASQHVILEFDENVKFYSRDEWENVVRVYESEHEADNTGFHESEQGSASYRL
ncbi:MAG: hypothetical protein V3U10_02760, partial [Bacteroidota bacterium]